MEQPTSIMKKKLAVSPLVAGHLAQESKANDHGTAEEEEEPAQAPPNQDWSNRRRSVTIVTPVESVSCVCTARVCFVRVCWRAARGVDTA